MSTVYRLFGSELSPYSIKVSSYFRYKKIPYEWIVRSTDNQEEFQRYAKLPLVPLVVSPEGQGLQDSTPIIEHFEPLYPEPAIHPPNSALSFLSALIEEYGDEWGNKPMFHYRWFYQPDQQATAERIVGSTRPGLSEEEFQKAVPALKERMILRLKFVGSSAQTKEQIEQSFQRQLTILNVHLSARPYLFGERPAFADFGLYAQLYQCSTDPTPGAIMRANAPYVLAWAQRMLDPRNKGEFETWETLKPTLAPLFSEEIGGMFLPWTTANAQAITAGQPQFSLILEGKPYTQDAQKYHVRSLEVLRTRYANVKDKSTLDLILKEVRCFDWLQ